MAVVTRLKKSRTHGQSGKHLCFCCKETTGSSVQIRNDKGRTERFCLTCYKRAVKVCRARQVGCWAVQHEDLCRLLRDCVCFGCGQSSYRAHSVQDVRGESESYCPTCYQACLRKYVQLSTPVGTARNSSMQAHQTTFRSVTHTEMHEWLQEQTCTLCGRYAARTALIRDKDMSLERYCQTCTQRWLQYRDQSLPTHADGGRIYPLTHDEMKTRFKQTSPWPNKRAKIDEQDGFCNHVDCDRFIGKGSPYRHARCHTDGHYYCYKHQERGSTDPKAAALSRLQSLPSLRRSTCVGCEDVSSDLRPVKDGQGECKPYCPTCCQACLRKYGQLSAPVGTARSSQAAASSQMQAHETVVQSVTHAGMHEWLQQQTCTLCDGYAARTALIRDKDMSLERYCQSCFRKWSRYMDQNIPTHADGGRIYSITHHQMREKLQKNSRSTTKRAKIDEQNGICHHSVCETSIRQGSQYKSARSRADGYYYCYRHNERDSTGRKLALFAGTRSQPLKCDRCKTERVRDRNIADDDGRPGYYCRTCSSRSRPSAKSAKINEQQGLCYRSGCKADIHVGKEYQRARARPDGHYYCKSHQERGSTAPTKGPSSVSIMTLKNCQIERQGGLCQGCKADIRLRRAYRNAGRGMDGLYYCINCRRRLETNKELLKCSPPS